MDTNDMAEHFKNAFSGEANDNDHHEKLLNMISLKGITTSVKERIAEEEKRFSQCRDKIIILKTTLKQLESISQ